MQALTEPWQIQKNAFVAAEAKVFSQFNEDGILSCLFDRLGKGDQRFVEFGIGNGKECNTANLSIHHDWGGLLMDGNPVDVEKAQRFYGSRSELKPAQVVVKHAFITAGNINDHLADHARGGATDLLSVDIDGSDLWVWRAITAVRPRVLVIEYNAVFGPERSVSVVDDPQFERMKYHASGLYHGASLAALTKVSRDKGYILVGCESHGVNAFFVEQIAARNAGLVELNPAQAYYEHAWRAERFPSTNAQFEIIKEMKMIEI